MSLAYEYEDFMEELGRTFLCNLFTEWIGFCALYQLQYMT